MERTRSSLRDDKLRRKKEQEQCRFLRFAAEWKVKENMTITVNGQARELEGLDRPVALGLVVEALGLKADRVAVECNGEIAPRAEWGSVQVNEGDRLEIVHFVGGGCCGAKAYLGG
jgi:sulfur carrier protein